jgi:large subunit ribosomal protein L32
MAVPKKRVSKAKKNSRKANWYRMSKIKAQNALSLAKSLLTQRSTSFFIPTKSEEEEE